MSCEFVSAKTESRLDKHQIFLNHQQLHLDETSPADFGHDLLHSIEKTVAMIAFTHGSASLAASMDVPQTQNTAPVLEFRCLYTQDLRRKQKRWQDGRLKFHTFNKRIMVYDERSNFVGDTHWKEDTEFGEGEELNLERGGVLVEVGECVGKREQDLTELVDKRVKEREERFAAKVSNETPRGQLQHKPLNSLLTPSGHHGRAAVSILSPFETKQQLVKTYDENQDERPAKRRKQNEVTSNKSGYAQNLMGATLSLASSKPSSTPIIRYEPLKMTPLAHQKPVATIDLTSDSDENHTTMDGNRVMEKKPAPAKRKPYKSPPTKSGYASNLTGAALTLSKPASSAPWRTSNLKPKQHVIQARSHDREDASSSSGNESPPCPQLSKEESIKPAADSRSVMTNPRKFKPEKIIQPRSSSPAMRHGQENSSSSSEEEAGLRRKQATGKTSLKRIKNPRKTIAELQTPDLKRPQPRSSSSAPTTLELLPSRLINNLQKSSINQVSGMEPTLEKPISTLKIKSRPARKMMMFMDRTNSRPKYTGPPVDTTPHALVSTEPLIASNKPVLSQATIHLNEFSKRQEELLQARLNKTKQAHQLAKRLSSSFMDLSTNMITLPKQAAASTKTVPFPTTIHQNEVAQNQEERLHARFNKTRRTITPAEFLSSPGDNGIDHQTIDLLLSRKEPAVPETILTSRPEPREETPDSSTNESTEKISLTEDTNPHSPGGAEKDEPPMPRPQLFDPNPASPVDQARVQDTPPPDDPRRDMPEWKVSSDITRDAELRSRAAQTQGYPDSKLNQEKTTSHEGEPQAAILPVASLSTHEDFTANKQSAQHDLNSISKLAELHTKNTEESFEHLPQVETISIKPVSCPPKVTITPTKPLSLDMDNTIQMASDRFREMLKSSASQPVDVNGLPSHSVNVSQHSDGRYSPSPDLGEIEKGSHCPAMKPSSQPSAVVMDNQILQTNAFSQIPPIDSRAIGIPSHATISVKPNNARLAPRAMMANPATRGKSLQSLAAKTADPFLPQMAPPPQRSASRPETINAKGSMEVGTTSGGSLLEASSTGPWSREAFDLFGDWRPPGR